MKKIMLALAASLAFASAASAQITVSAPWVRATVPVQKSSGAFMVLRAARDARLLEVTSPVAASVEIHQSDMKDGMMKMQEVDGIDLPAGKDVDLSGGYHVMLMGLKRQLKEGETVPLTLVVQAGKQKPQRVTVNAVVKPLTYAPAHAGH